ncbi:mariner Mos1 transposase [Trichonephila clavipes]|uniref:Mariner Mos1 transposase n=1 Tax=Trichonephila clavipes TaxID=2585209 RepID=A0A8X7BCT6_TRICX|nr:mariner Mos1 transposase [Trichonephila clavipes]
MDAELKEMAPFGEKIVFHHGNAQAHTSALAAAKLIKLGYELLPHPPYSPDLAPCDFFLFFNLKKSLAGQKCHSNEEVISPQWPTLQTSRKLFSDWLRKLEHRWVKCIELKGDYIEKKLHFFPKFFFFQV